MKVTFHKNIAAYSGKDKWQKCIYSTTLNGTACTIRRYIKPRETDQQRTFANAAKAISDIWSNAQTGYRSDLMIYSWLIKNTKEFQGKYMTSSYGWFIKISWNLMKQLSLTPTDLNVNTFVDNDCSNVKKTVEIGFIPLVDKVNDLINDIA